MDENTGGTSKEREQVCKTLDKTLSITSRKIDSRLVINISSYFLSHIEVSVLEKGIVIFLNPRINWSTLEIYIHTLLGMYTATHAPEKKLHAKHASGHLLWHSGTAFSMYGDYTTCLHLELFTVESLVYIYHSYCCLP